MTGLTKLYITINFDISWALFKVPLQEIFDSIDLVSNLIVPSKMQIDGNTQVFCR